MPNTTKCANLTPIIPEKNSILHCKEQKEIRVHIPLHLKQPQISPISVQFYQYVFVVQLIFNKKKSIKINNNYG
jgi:hypothetical protein